ncbi:MAG: protein-methionine-sulfoxide reductase heme-binding subunit MsrQ [Pseudomonadota bacterium]
MLTNQSGKRYKPVLFVLLLVPLGFLVYRFLVNDLGANPIETINRYTGDWALRILLATLVFSPLIRITHWNNIIQFRRMFGLFAFFYVCVHLTSYIVLDQYFDFSEIIDDVFKRPFITAGFSAFILLIPLAITSTNKMVERLQYRWIQLHRLVYIIAILAVLHFWWMVKVDTREPMIYAIILAILLGFRLIFYIKRKV